MFDSTGTSNFAVTHMNTYSFIPTDTNMQRQTEQFGGGVTLLYNTEQFYSIFYWLVFPFTINTYTGYILYL